MEKPKNVLLCTFEFFSIYHTRSVANGNEESFKRLSWISNERPPFQFPQLQTQLWCVACTCVRLCLTVSREWQQRSLM